MARIAYHYRIKANVPFDERKVYDPPTLPELQRFTEVVWYGMDDEGWCVYKRDPYTGEVVRIDFEPPVGIYL